MPQSSANDFKEKIAAVKEGKESGIAQDLSGAQLSGEDLGGLNFSMADLSGADLTGTNLANTNLFKANLARAILIQANIESAELSGADLTGAVLDEAHGKNVGLGMACLKDAKLLNCDLADSTLSMANLQGADFSNACLKSARLRNANLTKSNFTNADLRDADMSLCNVSKAIFINADLRNARLRVIKGFEKANWIGVDIRDINFAGAYRLRRFILDQNYIKEFRAASRFKNALYYLWWLTCDCGRSISRWCLWVLIILLFYSWLYTFVEIDYGDHPTEISTFYYSVVTLTTLGYGDVAPASIGGQIIAMLEVITGYIMLGGLLSIFGSKMARRAD